MSSKVVLAGGSGLLGRALARRLAGLGWEVVILSRSPREEAAVREVMWNGETGGPWAAELDGAAALVNFAGRSLQCVFTLENSREILESRVNAVRTLGRAVAKCKQPPAVWVQCSGLGYYGATGLGLCDEDSPPGTDFLAEVCRRWEEALGALELAATRRVVLRFGPVLSRDGGAYPPLADLSRRFLGGFAGSGQQGFSWVHENDAIRALVQAVQRTDFTGAYNVCTPEPAINADFMHALRRSIGRPWAPPAPAFAVRLVARHLMAIDPQLILGGRACAPTRLLTQGFQFEFPELTGALRDLAKWQG
jgi:uncharacterized protein (TIGR01777 family)